MKRETITRMLNSVDDDYISQTAVFDPKSVQESPERIIHMKKKRIITFALAAALVIALGVGAYAAGLFGGKPEVKVYDVDHDDIDWLPDYANEIANTAYEPHDNAPTAEIAAMLADMDKGERSSLEFDTVREMEKTYGIRLLKAGSGEIGAAADLWLEEVPIVSTGFPADGKLPENGAHFFGWWISRKDGVRLNNLCYCCFNNPYYRQGHGFPLTKTEAVGEYEIRSLGVTASLVSGWNDINGQTERQIAAYFSYDGIDYNIWVSPTEEQDVTIEWLCSVLETLHY